MNVVLVGHVRHSTIAVTRGMMTIAGPMRLHLRKPPQAICQHI